MKPTLVLGHMLKVSADLSQLMYPKPQPTVPVQRPAFQPELREPDFRTQMNRNKLPHGYNVDTPIQRAPGMQFPGPSRAPMQIAPGAPFSGTPAQSVPRPPGIGGVQLPSGLFKTSADVATAPSQQDTNATAKALGTPPVKNTPIRAGLGQPMAPPPVANGGKMTFPSAANRAATQQTMKQIGQYKQDAKSGLTTGTSAPMIPNSANTQKTEPPVPGLLNRFTNPFASTATE